MPNLNITIQIDRAKNKNDPSRPDIVWPTMLEDDEPVLRGLTLEFFRGDTKLDGSDWVVVPEWCGTPQNLGTASFSEDSIGRYQVDQVDYEYIYRGNDFLVSESVIEDEYGSGATAPWERMPLASVRISDEDIDRDDDGRWTFCDDMDQDYARVNIRATLKRKEDEETHKYDVSPDLILDGTKKGNWQFRDSDLRYKIRPNAGRFGLQIQEVGTKSFFHYLYQENFLTGGPVGYTASWLDPEGIFYSPFDTTDTDNYKVTRTPSYSADAISGLILDLKRKQKVELYLMPRRWAYFSYRSAGQVDTDLGDVLVTDTCDLSEHHEYPDWDYCALPTGDVFNDLPECNGQDNCNNIGDESILDGTVIDCDGTASANCIFCAISDFYTHTRTETKTYTWVGGATGCGASSESETGPAVDYCGPGSPCTSCFADIDILIHRTISFPAELREETRHVCLWWDSPPVNFEMLGPKARTEPYADIYAWNGSDYVKTRFTFVGDESLADAQDNADDAGLDPDTVISGYNSIHAMGSSDWTQFKKLDPTPSQRQTWNKTTNMPDFQPLNFEDTARAENYQGFYTGEWEWNDGEFEYQKTDDDVVVTCAQHAVASRFWQAEVPGAEWPYEFPRLGVGISPNKAGTLCAVIKIGGKTFFVWRKTDEEFMERDLEIDAPAGKPDVDFLGRQPSAYGGDHYDGWDAWRNFGGTGRKLTSIMIDKEVSCAKPSEKGMNRDPGDSEGVTTWIENSDTTGNVLLEMPVWIIASKHITDGESEYP